MRERLLNQLAAEASTAALAVDALLERLLDTEADIVVEPGRHLGRLILELLTYLALVQQTPFASRAIERWCRNAPAHAAAVEAFAEAARDYLGPSNRTGRQAAYLLLAAAAESSLARWNRDPTEHLAGADLSDEQLAELLGAAQVTHEIAQQIYFASGAFDQKQNHERPGRGDLTTFSDLAFPVLATCAATRLPQSIHEALKTMIFLAPTDETRALQMIARAIPAEGLYAGESLAGTEIIPYLERLLSEERQLVLFDETGVAAFRHLLATFASAGNQEEALALAYTFADVFR